MAHDSFDDLDGPADDALRHPPLGEFELADTDAPDASLGVSADEPFSFEADEPEAPRGDFLGTEDGRYEPVRVNRRLVLGALLIAGAAVLLGLLVLSGDPATPNADLTVERPEAAPPEFLERGDPYAADDGTGLAAQPDVAYADPYADPYGAAYAAPAYAPDYGPTAPVGPTASVPSYSSPSYASAPRGAMSMGKMATPEADAFERALLSPVVARAGALTLDADAPFGGPSPEAAPLDPELQREVDEIRLIAEQFAPSVAAPEAPERAPLATAAVPPPASSSGGLVAPEAPQRASGGTPGPESRRAFAARTSGLGEGRYGVRVQSPETPFVLQAGTVIPAALVTGLDSELPGAVTGQVTRDVYDSRAQRHVLVPKGSRLIGEYDDQIAYGQNRALVAWTRLVFPDGRSVALPGLDAKDLRGYSGLRGRVDRHFMQTFGSAVLLATVGAGAQLALPDGGGNDFAQSPQEVIAGQIALELSRVASKVVERGLDVQPTLRIAPGHRFTVFLARDLAFAGPYKTPPAELRFVRPSVPRRQSTGR
ncbi:TrbI/VirB10 family protein [Rubrivirga sp. S365]|uniref:TrbI/VirB10 family protein n=1 Tax=Rubrivirga sp. S365 TaxID=3076080 RepID=UPI0028C8F55A|nr:TrbI/VirB10 family protein [Rubrivirga sp. S365]MDT7858418.1 TrbI/VirB10 family protein [Rubrivirga sp. S365]